MTDPTEAALDALLATPPKKHGRAKAERLAEAQEILPPAMPAIPDGYFDQVNDAAAALPMVRATGDVSRAERLEGIVDQALGKMSEILDLQADPYDPAGLKLLSIQKDAIGSALTLAVKVDENHFRKRSASALVAILAKIAAEENQPTILAAE